MNPREGIMRFFSTLTICGCLAMAVATASGCVSISAPKWPWSKPDPAATAEAKLEGELGEDAEGDVISSEFISGDQGTPWELLKGKNIQKGWKKMTGRGPNEQVARLALAGADALYREGEYSKAIAKYKVVIDRWPDSAIEEDAMWQLAECYFFTDQYPKAEDSYDELVRKYANTRYLDRIAQRQFVIGDYWLKLDQKHGYWTLVPNVIDRSRPLFDTHGRALKTFDHVRINSPRGSRADDSLMAQGNAHFLRRQWLDADYFYGLLRSEYPDSDFLLEAHLLGLQSKLRSYQGPAYEGGVLDEAEILADQTLVQFPDQLAGDDEQRLMKTRARIAEQQATRHFNRASFYEKGEHYAAARIYYGLVARDYSTTSLGPEALAKLDGMQGLEDVSDNPFPTLTAFLNPDSLKEAELDAMAEAEVTEAVADRGQAETTTAGLPGGMSPR